MFKTILAGIRWFQPSPLAQEIVRLLISDRDGWVVSSHRMTHAKTGLAIWTANEDYGLHIEYRCSDGSERDVRLSKKDRRAIYRAAKWHDQDRALVIAKAATW